MSCIVKPSTVIKKHFNNSIYYYVLDDVATSIGYLGSVCVSSVGDLLRKSDGYFVINSVLEGFFEKVDPVAIKDCCPKEGELYLYRTEGEWRVIKYTKFSVGYCFDSLTTYAKYNLPGGVFVYPLVGITESMLNIDDEPIEAKYDYDKLAEEYHSLQEEYDKLGDDYEELYDSNNELVSDYQVLKEDKEDLEKKVEYYFDQCKHFKEEVDSLKKENEKLKTMNEVKTEAIENYIHSDSCKYFIDGECCVQQTNVEPYQHEIERLKNLVIRLTEELMERR